MKIKAIIVEDEQSGLENLALKIERNCPDIQIVAKCLSGEDAILEIQARRPELLFLDINLGTMTGFDVLARLPHIPFEVIFTTSYDNYTIQAIRASAVDYLLKPVADAELVEAVNRARKKQVLKQSDTRLALPTDNGLRLVDVHEIAWCEADDNATILYLEPSGQSVRIPRTLHLIEEKLPAAQFYRIHRSHLVNRKFVETFTREGFVVLKTKSRKKLSLARDKKDDFLDWLGLGN